MTQNIIALLQATAAILAAVHGHNVDPRATQALVSAVTAVAHEAQKDAPACPGDVEQGALPAECYPITMQPPWGAEVFYFQRDADNWYHPPRTFESPGAMYDVFKATKF